MSLVVPIPITLDLVLTLRNCLLLICVWFEMPIFHNPHGLMVRSWLPGSIPGHAEFHEISNSFVNLDFALHINIYAVVIYSTYAMNCIVSYVLLSVQKKKFTVVIRWYPQRGLSIQFDLTRTVLPALAGVLPIGKTS